MMLTGNEVGSNVDDNRSGLEPRALDELGLSDSRDDDIGLSELEAETLRCD